MNPDKFKQLLFEEESAVLDFKKGQYPFVKATEHEKSELLKDILGFANAWRRSEAYILIGVEEVRGGQGNVVGIESNDHLYDHSLQQFVNNLTNQPVRFHYEAFDFEGKQVGIICIDEQIRPVYLKRDYGKLEKEKVYVRRGSSTDPNKPASPEEIAQMRVGLGQPTAELRVEFADIEKDDALGTSISWDAEYCEMPEREEICDLSPPRTQDPFGIEVRHNLFGYPNKNFYRELANFEFTRRLFRPIRVIVRNLGRVSANNVRLEIIVPVDIGVMVLETSDMPTQPKPRRDFLSQNSFLDKIRSPFREPGEIHIDRNNSRYRIVIEGGDLQPGRRVWSNIFYIGKGESGNLALRGLAFADNLPKPEEFELTASVNVTREYKNTGWLYDMAKQYLR